MRRRDRSAGSGEAGIAHAGVRTIVGLLLTGHGVRKLSSRLGGSGLAGATAQMESLGLRPGRIHAISAGVTQTAGGLLMASGLATPLGGAIIASNMIVAMRTACVGNGPWGINGGWEYPLVLAASSLAVAERGGGPLSLDRRLGLERSGPLYGAASAVLATAAAGAVLSTRRLAAGSG